MAIEFRCPNGHRLSCPVERAGTAGKCPKCGVPFVVPSTEVAAAAASSLSSSSLAVSDAMAPGSGRLNVEVATGEFVPRAPIAPIVFLCPNGHKLNCPPSMQGKPGKCPHCGARFLIPSADESFSEDDSLDEGSELEAMEGSGKNISVEQVVSPAYGNVSDDSGPLDLPPDFTEQIRQSEGAQASALSSSGPAFSSHASSSHSSSSPAASSLPHAFRELWGQRGRGAALRIHLRSGVVVTPDRYAAQASDDECAIFAVKEADGGYSISAIAWAQVERISLEGLKTLPEELFH